MTSVLLDTNAYSRMFSGDQAVLEALGGSETVYMSVVVIAELYSGFKNGSREKENRAALKRFLSGPTVKVLDATIETADLYSVILLQLKKSGRPIPTLDVWIAAHVLETGAVLVTYDKHFREVAGLRFWGEFN